MSQVISRCGVPTFFLISSILLYRTKRDYKSTIKAKVKTLLIPYLFWNSFWVLFLIFLQNFSLTAPFFSETKTPVLEASFSELLGMYGIGFSLPYPVDYPLWFMRDLMVITLFFPIIGKAAEKFPKSLLVCAAVLLLIPLEFPLKQALLWFLVGACIVKLRLHITVLDSIPLWKFSLVYWLGAFITLFTESAVIDTAFIFIGILYWARASKHIFNSKKISSLFLKLSESIFIIYVLHELTLTSLKKICFKLFPTEPIWFLAEYLVLPVIVILGCIVATVILRKIAPKLYSVLTGSR